MCMCFESENEMMQHQEIRDVKICARGYEFIREESEMRELEGKNHVLEIKKKCILIKIR